MPFVAGWIQSGSGRQLERFPPAGSDGNCGEFPWRSCWPQSLAGKGPFPTCPSGAEPRGRCCGVPTELFMSRHRRSRARVGVPHPHVFPPPSPPPFPCADARERLKTAEGCSLRLCPPGLGLSLVSQLGEKRAEFQLFHGIFGLEGAMARDTLHCPRSLPAPSNLDAFSQGRVVPVVPMVSDSLLLPGSSVSQPHPVVVLAQRGCLCVVFLLEFSLAGGSTQAALLFRGGR